MSRRDFTIGGLDFNFANSDTRPYQRATAEFRKQQFDSAQTVGDQSLTGWWTRGQLSFHKGAGIKYYEVLEGSEILNRFWKSSGVDVTEPGKLKLAREATDRADIYDIQTLTYGTDWVDNYLLALRAGGTLTSIKILAGAVSGYTTAAVSPAAITTVAATTGSNTTAWVCGNTYVEKWTPGAATTTAMLSFADAVYNVFFAKGRVWVVDLHGRFYMFATTDSGAKTSADSFGSVVEYPSPWNNAGDWKWAEGPAGVYAANRDRVYFIGLDPSSAAPTPTPPRLVAQLPENEHVGSMEYALGYLVLATANGVRFAQPNDSTGDLTIGPLVNESTDHTNCTGIAVNRDLVMVTGEETGLGGAIFTFDLSQWVSDLVPAYHVSTDLGASVTGAHGVIGFSNGTHYWSESPDLLGRVEDDTWSASTLVSEGEVYTGLHRFGTLEGKQFASVRVRVGGQGGTVDVYRVDSEFASPVYLDSIDAGAGAVEVDLGMTAAVESIGLRFVLHRDGLTTYLGPDLLGYQLKALPVPTRQRLIRVPLMMFDVERVAPGMAQGREGAAWERLAELESMERSGGIFTFTDHRTGETGECYIESVEFENRTPPGGRGGGHGGVVYLTIRKLD